MLYSYDDDDKRSFIFYFTFRLSIIVGKTGTSNAYAVVCCIGERGGEWNFYAATLSNRISARIKNANFQNVENTHLNGFSLYWANWLGVSVYYDHRLFLAVTFPHFCVFVWCRMDRRPMWYPSFQMQYSNIVKRSHGK